MGSHLGIAQLSQWEQAAQFDPTNPNQITRMQYAGIPGEYGSWYYNKVPTTGGALQGFGFPLTRNITHAGSGGGFGAIPVWDGLSPAAQAGVALVIGTIAGYFGWQKFGGKIKGKLGLAGAGRCNRRRR